MKKTIAILVACIMLIASVPFSVSAANTDITGTSIIDSAYTINTGDSITVKANASLTITSTITVKNGGNLVIETGGSVIFASSGRLYNEGTVTVKNGGNLTFSGTGTEQSSATLYNAATGMISFGTTATGLISDNSVGYNYGDITNSSKMTINGDLWHNVTIPGNYSVSYDYRETWNRQPTTVNFNVYYYMYQQGDTDDAYANVENFKKYPCVTETNVLVPDGEKLFVMIVPVIGPDGTGEWVGADRMKISAGTAVLDVTTVLDTESPNATRTPENGAVFTVTPSNAFEIEVETTKYKDLVKIFDITLPRTEAYYVITDNNDVDRVDVEFGKTLSFRVILEPEYDKSDIYVYVNSLHQNPAEFGYYRISGPMQSDGTFATAGGVQDNLTITVMGVTSNESQEQMNGFVAMIQEIVALIQEIFSYFASLFSGFGLGGSEAA